MSSYNDLLKIQQAFSEGILDIQDVDEDTLDELIRLYKTQISGLEQSISHNKQEIVKIRKKCGF